MLNDKSLTEYLIGTVIQRMWQTHFNDVPNYLLGNSDARSIYELEKIAIAAIQVSGSWKGVVSCSVDGPALDILAQKLLVITAEMSFREKRSALLNAADFVYQYLKVAIGPDLVIYKPTLQEFKTTPPEWFFGVIPVYDKCIRIGAGRFWLTIIETPTKTLSC